MSSVAVVLAGCGRGDGSEIQEAVSVLLHLSRLHARVRCFAPDQAAVDVVDHATGKVEAGGGAGGGVGSGRNLMVEAARISRGDIAPLAGLHAKDFDAVIFPGGFGVAKNLCTFAKDGAACSVHPQVERVIREFHGLGKPIGLVCIAPVLGARVLGKKAGGPGVEVTLGNVPASEAGSAASAIEAMGATHVCKHTTECHVDEARRVVSTPAYMHDATPWEVYQGIGELVERVVAMARHHAGSAGAMI